VDPARLCLLFPSALAVRSNVTCKEEKNTSKVSVLPPFFLSDLLLFSLSLGLFFSAGCRSGRRFSVGNGAASVGVAGGRRVAAGRCWMKKALIRLTVKTVGLWVV